MGVDWSSAFCFAIFGSPSSHVVLGVLFTTKLTKDTKAGPRLWILFRVFGALASPPRQASVVVKHFLFIFPYIGELGHVASEADGVVHQRLVMLSL